MRNRTFRKCVRIRDSGNEYVTNQVALMANKCPADEKVRLYHELDSSGLLSDLYKDADAFGVALFVIGAFEGRDTDEALSILEHSDSWRNYPRKQVLHDELIDLGGKRLLPALAYSNNLKKDSTYFSGTDQPEVEEPSIQKTSATDDQEEKSGLGPGNDYARHVTVEATKKSIKVQVILAVVAIPVAVGIAVYGSTEVAIFFAAIALGWLFIAIPIQRWWHHG